VVVDSSPGSRACRRRGSKERGERRVAGEGEQERGSAGWSSIPGWGSWRASQAPRERGCSIPLPEADGGASVQGRGGGGRTVDACGRGALASAGASEKKTS
jgi:hypothetical protein